jgi:hypothetical protein
VSKRRAADAASPALPSHDRPKARALPLELPFWVDLGIADERHRLVPAMARKWKQIDKFLEVLEHALADAGIDETGPRRGSSTSAAARATSPSPSMPTCSAASAARPR